MATKAVVPGVDIGISDARGEAERCEDAADEVGAGAPLATAVSLSCLRTLINTVR